MTMMHIQGQRLKNRDLPKFTWNADLIAFDGPLLSLFKSDNGVDALFVWLDCDKKKNRWAIIDVARNQLRLLLTEEASLLDVFKASTSVVLFDSGASLIKTNITRTQWQNLPSTYLPKDTAFLSKQVATEDAVRLAAEQPKPYSIKLDGELYIDDLAAIPRLYQQLYSFHYGLEHLDRLAVRSTISDLMERWTGGFNAVNLFTGLWRVTPSIHRARVKTLAYNSPGAITMELLPVMADRIRAVAERALGDSEDLEALYSEVYSYFRANGIAGFDDVRSRRDEKLADGQIRELDKYLNEFLGKLGLESYSDLFEVLEIGPLPRLRSLLAYYRRLRKLLRYMQQDLISLT